MYDVNIILGVFEPLPPLWPQNLFCLSANLVHFLTPPSPFCADVIYGSPSVSPHSLLSTIMKSSGVRTCDGCNEDHRQKWLPLADLAVPSFKVGVAA